MIEDSDGAAVVRSTGTGAIARTPIIIRHQGIGRVSEQEALDAMRGPSGWGGMPRDMVVDTAQFENDIEGGSWERSDGYLWQRAAEIRQQITNTPNARVVYFGAMPEVPHAIALGAYVGDEYPVEPFDSHRDFPPETENRWKWPDQEQTLFLESTGVPHERSNAAGPAVVRVEISASVNDEHVRTLVGSTDVAHLRIRPREGTPIVAEMVRSLADVNEIRQHVRAALAAIVECFPNVDVIHLFVAAPVSACLVTGQELRLRNMPPVQTYRYRRGEGGGVTRPAIRLTAAGPSPADLPLTERERQRAAELRRELWETALRDVERYAANKQRERPSIAERWYARLEPRTELGRVQPFPTLPPVYVMIEGGATVDPVPMDPPNFYGYQRQDRRWRVSDEFLLRLDEAFGSNPEDSRTLVRLFLFHESSHVAHGITKAKTEEVGKFANCLEHVDYTADLYAVLHELDRAVWEAPALLANFDHFKAHAAYLIDLVIRSLWAFEEPAPLQRLEIRRIRRYLNWYWQHARVLMSRSLLQFAAVLARKPVVEIAGLDPQVESRRYYGMLRRFDPFVGLELAIVLDNEELWRIPTSVTVPLDHLMAAFSDHNHGQIQQGFRQIFENAEASKHALPHEQDIP